MTSNSFLTSCLCPVYHPFTPHQPSMPLIAPDSFLSCRRSFSSKALQFLTSQSLWFLNLITRQRQNENLILLLFGLETHLIHTAQTFSFWSWKSIKTNSSFFLVRGFGIRKFPEDMDAVLELKQKQLNIVEKKQTKVKKRKHEEWLKVRMLLSGKHCTLYELNVEFQPNITGPWRL